MTRPDQVDKDIAVKLGVGSLWVGIIFGFIMGAIWGAWYLR